MTTHSIDVAGLKGLKWEEFVDLMNENHVSKIIDCRDNPNPQWTPWFCKSNMQEALKSEHILYRHFKILGNPKPKEGKRTRESFQNCGRLESHQGELAIKDLIDDIVADTFGLCLVCYCGDYDACHLADIVDKLRHEYEAHTQAKLNVHILNQSHDVIANRHLIVDEDIDDGDYL